MEKIFVYGKLKDGEAKSFYLPKAKTHKHRLYGFKMFKTKKGTAGVVKGNKDDYVDGEIKQLIFP